MKIPEELEKHLQGKTEPEQNPFAIALVQKCLARAEQHDGNLDLALAASFDLLVTSKYFKYVVPENWLWCEHSKYDFYPILNACPACILENRFVFHQGNKPGSGQIGPATAEAFREILAAYFHLTSGDSIQVYNGSEPIDLAIIDIANKSAFIAEVKASPLFTPPLAIEHAAKSFQTVHAAPLRHSVGVVRNMHDVDAFLFFPTAKNESIYAPIPLKGLGSPDWPEKAMATAIQQNTIPLDKYFDSWCSMWEAYELKKSNDSLFWFTGACSLPRNPGEGWPKSAAGKPQGTISDGKTSVGMDRTDDIKKSTFQVLNLGVSSRKGNFDNWKIKIGLASNLHAARHYDSYLAPYQDIVWGWGDHEKSEAPNKWFNLFDGIISFSRSHTRDQWLKQIVSWHKGKKHAQ
jgi:hypothetical protein